jgi:hypothetical protein
MGRGPRHRATRLAFAIVFVFVLGGRGAHVSADVVWGPLLRTVMAGTKTYWMNPPMPPTANIQQDSTPASGPWTRMVSASSGMVFSRTTQVSNINVDENRIIGAGTASWGPPFMGISTRQFGFGRTDLSATFTLTEPTAFVSDVELGRAQPPHADAWLRSSTGQQIDLDGGIEGGVLQAGTWTYYVFAGMPSIDYPSSANSWFEVDFQLVPEPATACVAAILAPLLLLRRLHPRHKRFMPRRYRRD